MRLLRMVRALPARHRRLELICTDGESVCAIFVDGALAALGRGAVSCPVRTGQRVRFFVLPSDEDGSRWKLREVGADRMRLIDAGWVDDLATARFRTRRMPVRRVPASCTLRRATG